MCADRNPTKKFLIGILRRGLQPSTIVDAIVMMDDSGLPRDNVSAMVLEATKNCKTDEEFLAAVRAVLKKEG